MRILGFGIAAALAAAGAVRAQEPPRYVGEPRMRPLEAEPPPKPAPALKVDLGGGLEVVYDDNVFKLDPRKKDLVDAVGGRIARDVNNRFSRMESADDFIVHSYGRADLSWRGVGGKKAKFRFEPGAYLYTQNELCSYSELKAKFAHETWKGGEAYLQTGYIPRRFQRNYFAGGVDANANGNISSGERVYKHAVYDEFALQAGVSSVIASPFSGELYGMGSVTDFAEPFDNRDLRTFGGGLVLTADVTDWFHVGFVAEIETVAADGDREAVLIDEDVFGEQDGVAGLDSHALVATPVDRSHLSTSVGPTVTIRPAPWLTLGSFFAWKRKSFSSTERLDVTYKDRQDDRYSAGVETKVDIAPNTKMWIEYRWTRQVTDRPLDPDNVNNDLDYRRNEITLGFEVYF